MKLRPARVLFSVAVLAWVHAVGNSPGATPAAVPADGSPTQPEALQRAEQVRLGTLRCMRLEIKRTFSPVGGSTQHRWYTWRCAGAAYLRLDHGDEEGIVARDESGAPAPIDHNTATYHLVRDGQVWQHRELSPGAQVFPADRVSKTFNVFDFRVVGLSPFSNGEMFEDALAEEGQPPLRYSADDEGSLKRVTGRSGKYAITWWIDPQRDWNVVRTLVESDGASRKECVIELDNVDGFWIPRKVEYVNLQENNRHVLDTLYVVFAAVNRPDLPTDLTPADAGIEPGTNIDFPLDERVGLRMWDGQRAITPEEFNERVARGELQSGPTIRREFSRLKVLNMRRKPWEALEAEGRILRGDGAELPLQWTLDAWERYTAEFIERHGLDAAQRTRALAILHECQDQARTHYARVQREVEQSAARRADPKATGTATSAPAQTERERRLMAHFTTIFEERLKPRLDQLLTPAQRAAARPPASQPAP